MVAAEKMTDCVSEAGAQGTAERHAEHAARHAAVRHAGEAANTAEQTRQPAFLGVLMHHARKRER